MKDIWKSIGQRILQGERDAAALITEVVATILASPDLTREWVTSTVTTRIRGMVADGVKPAGKTSRVPAGQGDFGWVDLPARFGYERLKTNVKRAYAKMARARIEAEILGVIDASGADVDAFENLGELMEAAHVPADLVAALAA